MAAAAVVAATAPTARASAAVVTAAAAPTARASAAAVVPASGASTASTTSAASAASSHGGVVESEQERGEERRGKGEGLELHLYCILRKTLYTPRAESDP